MIYIAILFFILKPLFNSRKFSWLPLCLLRWVSCL